MDRQDAHRRVVIIESRDQGPYRARVADLSERPRDDGLDLRILQQRNQDPDTLGIAKVTKQNLTLIPPVARPEALTTEPETRAPFTRTS